MVRRHVTLKFAGNEGMKGRFASPPPSPPSGFLRKEGNGFKKEKKEKPRTKASCAGGLGSLWVKGYPVCDKQSVTANEVTAVIPGKGYFKVGGGAGLDLVAFLQHIPKKAQVRTLLAEAALS